MGRLLRLLLVGCAVAQLGQWTVQAQDTDDHAGEAVDPSFSSEAAGEEDAVGHAGGGAVSSEELDGLRQEIERLKQEIAASEERRRNQEAECDARPPPLCPDLVCTDAPEPVCSCDAEREAVLMCKSQSEAAEQECSLNHQSLRDENRNLVQSVDTCRKDAESKLKADQERLLASLSQCHQTHEQEVELCRGDHQKTQALLQEARKPPTLAHIAGMTDMWAREMLASFNVAVKDTRQQLEGYWAKVKSHLGPVVVVCHKVKQVVQPVLVKVWAKGEPLRHAAKEKLDPAVQAVSGAYQQQVQPLVRRGYSEGRAFYWAAYAKMVGALEKTPLKGHAEQIVSWFMLAMSLVLGFAIATPIAWLLGKLALRLVLWAVWLPFRLVGSCFRLVTGRKSDNKKKSKNRRKSGGKKKDQ